MRNVRTTFLVVALLLGSVICSVTAQAKAHGSAPAYAISDLGTGTGNTSTAWHINDRGEVLWSWGTTQDPALGRYRDAHLAIWYDAAVTDLTALGLDQAIAINDAGIVLGSEGDRGVLYRPQGHVEPLPGFERDAYPADINDAGAVTGNVQGLAEIVSGDDVIEIPSPPGYEYVEPAAINAAGSVAGTARLSPANDMNQRAVLYADGVTIVLDAAPGAPSSGAADINEAGLVVGHPGIRGVHPIPDPGRAFLYDPSTGSMTDLGVLPGYKSSMAMAINNAGQVVGYALGTDQGEPPFIRAFLYDHRTETMHDLNDLIPPDSGWTLLAAADINDAGQIVGRGWIDGEIHAFLLTPSS